MLFRKFGYSKEEIDSWSDHEVDYHWRACKAAEIDEKHDLIHAILSANPRGKKQIDMLNQQIGFDGLKQKSYLMRTDDYDRSKVEETKRRAREEAEKIRLAKTARNSPPA